MREREGRKNEKDRSMESHSQKKKRQSNRCLDRQTDMQSTHAKNSHAQIISGNRRGRTKDCERLHGALFPHSAGQSLAPRKRHEHKMYVEELAAGRKRPREKGQGKRLGERAQGKRFGEKGQGKRHGTGCKREGNAF